MLKKNKKKISLGLFGLTYKPDTNLIEGSQGDSLLKEINRKKLKFKKINIFDKFLTSNSVKKYNKQLSFFKSKISFLNNSDIIIIMYPSSENDILKRYKTKKNKFILDCWRKNMKLNNNLKLVEFGKYFD